MKRRFRLSVIGLTVAALYVVPSALFVGRVMISPGDDKGNFVYLQIPIALQLGVAQSAGLGPALQNISWTEAYLLFWVPIVLLLYLAGWTFDEWVSRRNPDSN